MSNDDPMLIHHGHMMTQNAPTWTQDDPTWLKVDLQIFIFAVKTNGFLLILKNQLFRVLALLGIHLRPL
jgi:hypothetical protein